MRIKIILSWVFLALATISFAQTDKQPVLVILKSGENIDAVHFGQLRCGKEVYGENYILVRGKFNPETIEQLSKEYHVPKNYMFIGAPSDRFPYRLSELGGVRLII